MPVSQVRATLAIFSAPSAAPEAAALPAVQAPDEPETDPAPEAQENTAPATETPDEPTQVETGAAALQFSAQEADEIRIAGACSYPVDEAALRLKKLFEEDDA